MNITMKITIQSSGKYLNVLLQDDVCVLVVDIQAQRMIHDGKEKAQSEFTSQFKLKPSTLY